MPSCTAFPPRRSTGASRRGAVLLLLASAAGAAVIGTGRHQGAAPAAVAPVAELRAVPAPQPLQTAARARQARSTVAVIDVEAMPLVDVAHRLAAATRTSLEGAEMLRDAGTRVTLKWQRHGADAAWQQLLGAGTSYASICAERGCIVRVVGQLAGQHSTPLPMAGTASAVAPQPDPPGLFPSNE